MIPGPPPFFDRGRRGYPPMMEGGGFPPFGLEALQKDLNLTGDQMTKIKTILDELRKQAPRPGEKPGVYEMGDPLRQAREKMDQEIEKVLTDEQKQKFQELRKTRRPGPAEGGPRRPPSPL